MNRAGSEPLKRLAPILALCAGLLAVAAMLSLTTAARGASDRTLAAAIDITQTCSGRVQPSAPIEVGSTVSNTGDAPLTVTSIQGDAGTPDNVSDDFTPTYQSGNNPPVETLDPGEQWVYAGSYTAPTEDVTNNVAVEAVAPGSVDVSDIAPCETDVVQQPAPGVIVAVRVVKGTVLVKEPGSNTFVELKGPTEIPIGAQLNTINGTVRLTAGLGGGRKNSSDFYAGVFSILQAKAKNAYTTLRLEGGNFRVCRARGSARSLNAVGRSRRPVRRLWGSGKGRFTTRGRYSAATVRGTFWLVQDQCNGTLTRVRRGIVQVRDFRRRRNIKVRAGHTYLARAPGS
jgi:hypothetical protein